MTSPFLTGDTDLRPCKGCWEYDKLNKDGFCSRCDHVNKLQRFADNVADLRLSDDKSNAAMLQAVIDSAKLLVKDKVE